MPTKNKKTKKIALRRPFFILGRMTGTPAPSNFIAGLRIVRLSHLTVLLTTRSRSTSLRSSY